MQAETRDRINRYLNVLVVVLAFSIPVYRKWVSIAAPLVTILWFVEGRFGAKIERLKRHWLTMSVMAFIAFNLLSLLWSADPAEGLGYVDKYRYLLLVPVIASSLRSRYRRLAEAAFLVGASLAVGLSYLVFAGVVRFRDAFPGNPSPTMSHLDFSMVLAVAAAIVLCRILEKPWPPRRLVPWIGLLIFLGGGLSINIGRSGQLAFAVTAFVLVWVVLGRRSPRIAVAVTLTTTAILLASYALFDPLHERVDSGIEELQGAVLEGRYDSNQGKRVAGFEVARDMVRERPLLGTGVGANMPRFLELLDDRHADLKPLVGWFPHFHNQYLQSITETGLVGLSLLLLMVVALIAGPYTDPHDRHLAVSLAAIYLVGFFGDPYLHKQLPLVLFATFAGLVSARDRSIVWDGDEAVGGS